MAATISEILDALSDYSDYEEVSSVTRAKSFITAGRQFLALPTSSTEQGSSASYTPALIQEEIRLAREFVRANDTTTASSTSVRFLSASEGFRR